jgi:hypothetical protein
MVFYFHKSSVLIISFIETNKVNNQILRVLHQVSLPVHINLILGVTLALASHPIRRYILSIQCKNLIYTLMHA